MVTIKEDADNLHLLTNSHVGPRGKVHKAWICLSPCYFEGEFHENF